MRRLVVNRFTSVFVALILLGVLLLPPAPIEAADHGDAPTADIDRSIDLNDLYVFLDPNDNTKLVMIVTLAGFIVPGEAVNFGVFDHRARYRIALELTGDAKADAFVTVQFSQRVSTTTPQACTVTLPNGRTFNAVATPANLSPTPPQPIITTDPNSGAQFFAGVVDDPFFFDIPGFNRFVASVLSGAADPSNLSRGRDSFAGYNTLAFAVSIPLSQISVPSSRVIGAYALAQRTVRTIFKNGTFTTKGDFVTLDRAGVPAVNVALVPFAKKDAYNFATTEDDAKGTFANDIVGTLKALGTNQQNIDILASVAVAKGDFLRLNTSIPNTGNGGGTNAEAAFPNGRRLGDDVVDTILFFVANQNRVGDTVNGNDVPFRDTFPFLAASQQPRDPGNIDDNTRN